MFGTLVNGEVAPSDMLAPGMTIVYNAPSDAVVTISLNNPTYSPAAFNLAISATASGVASGAAPAADYISKNAVLGPCQNPANSRYSTEKIPLASGQAISIQSDTAINYRVSGVDGADLTTAKYSF